MRGSAPPNVPHRSSRKHQHIGPSPSPNLPRSQRKPRLTPGERKERRRTRAVRHRQVCKAQGLCRDCTQPTILGQTRCTTCAENHGAHATVRPTPNHSAEPSPAGPMKVSPTDDDRPRPTGRLFFASQHTVQSTENEACHSEQLTKRPPAVSETAGFLENDKRHGNDEFSNGSSRKVSFAQRKQFQFNPNPPKEGVGSVP